MFPCNAKKKKKKESIKKTLLTHADRTSIVIGLRDDRHELTTDSVCERFRNVVVVKWLVLEMLGESRARPTCFKDTQRNEYI